MHIKDTRGVTGHRIAWARHLREERPLRQSSKLLSYVVLVILVASSTGCVTPAVTFKAAGHFEDSDELVDGYTQIGSGGTGTIMLVNRTTGARCTGLAQASYQPAKTNVGATGKAYVQCDDGRRIEVTWLHTTEAGGGGVGVDQYGHQMTIRFSMHEAEVQASIEGVRRHARRPQPLPAATAIPSGSERVKRTNAGSGIIMSPSGHVLTAGHRLEGCSQMAVKARNTVTDAQVLAIDAVNDLALLKVAERVGAYGILRVVPSVALGEARSLSSGMRCRDCWDWNQRSRREW
jgi:hypothetical protein